MLVLGSALLISLLSKYYEKYQIIFILLKLYTFENTKYLKKNKPLCSRSVTRFVAGGRETKKDGDGGQGGLGQRKQ